MVMFKKVFLVLLVLLFMGALMYGCGAPANDGDPIKDDEEETTMEEEMEEATPEEMEKEPSDKDEEEPSLQLEDWEAPTSLEELAATYKEIRHSWWENGEEIASVHYLFEGVETLDGVQTDKISFNINEENFTFWIDQEGETQKIEVGGESMPVEMEDMIFMPLTTQIFMPFHISQEWRVDQMLVHPPPGVEIKKTEEARKTIGDLTGTVYTFEATLEYPEVPQGEKGKFRWEIADFGEFQMLIGWESLERVGEELVLEFKIDRLALRQVRRSEEAEAL